MRELPPDFEERTVRALKYIEAKTQRVLNTKAPTVNNDFILLQYYYNIYWDLAFPVNFWDVVRLRPTMPDTIIRARQRIQEKGYCLPTDAAIAKRRRREVALREYFAENKI